MDKVRFGIVGIGNMGSSHARNIFNGKVQNGVLGAVCDTDPNRKKWTDENINGTPFFDNCEQMIKSGLIDALMIATPHYDHMPIARLAMENGLHVLTEKPAGVYTKQVREVNEYYLSECKPKGLIYGIMYNQRVYQAYKKMREIMQRGELGEMRRVVWIITNWYRNKAYYDSGTWRATWKGEGGGVLLNQCPHNLDLLQWICGMPEEVTAFCHEGKWHDIEVEDDVTAYLKFKNATGVFITTTGETPGTNRLEIDGDKGQLVLDHGKLIFKKLKMAESEFTQISKTPFASPECETIEVDISEKNEDHIDVLRAFTNALVNGTELVACGIEGINGLTLSNAMHLSSWTNKTITLPIDEELFLAELQKKYK